MSDEGKPSRRAMTKLVEMLGDIRAGNAGKLGKPDFAETLRECGAEIVADFKAGSKTELDDAGIEEAIRQRFTKILAIVEDGKLTIGPGVDVEAELLALSQVLGESQKPTAEVLGWLAFVEHLTHRQGTKLPDWSAFYAERAEVDRKIREHSDS